MKDLTGNKYGKLTVLSYSHTKNYRDYWKCECECGNIKVIMGKNLRYGTTKSCGCKHDITRPYNLKSLIGHKTGPYTVTSYAGVKKTSRYWELTCKCGSKRISSTWYIKNRTLRCKCQNMKKKSLKEEKKEAFIGNKFNKLTVIKFLGSNKRNQWEWECQCDCGNIVRRTTSDLTKGRKPDCGCVRREKNNIKKENIVYLYENHLTYDEIKEIIPCESMFISRTLNEAGISRTRGHNFRTPEQKQHAYRIMYGE